MTRTGVVVVLLAMCGCGMPETDAFAGAWNVEGQLTISSNGSMAKVGGPLTVVKASDGNFRFELGSCALIYLPEAKAQAPKLNAQMNTSCVIPRGFPMTMDGSPRPLAEDLQLSVSNSTASVTADILSITGGGQATYMGSVHSMTFAYTGKR